MRLQPFDMKQILYLIFPFLLTILSSFQVFSQNSYSANDTILTGAVVYEGDTIEAKTLSYIYIYSKAKYTNAKAKWTRLRNAVYVTYPYAKRAGLVFNDINRNLAANPKLDRKEYLKTREKELKQEFADPLGNLSVYQGKVLMKLINRETGNNCYAIIKDFKGGVTARFYQTILFFVGSSLKQSYNAAGEDAEIESIVKEVERMYGYRS